MLNHPAAIDGQLLTFGREADAERDDGVVALPGQGRGHDRQLEGARHPLEVVLGDAAGINGVEWDAVELPSQFMENW